MITTVECVNFLAECGAIMQSKYEERHNNVLRILFFKILTNYELVPREDRAWYKPIKPKPVFEDEQVRALWDIPLLYNNKINARVLIGQSAMVYCAGKPMEKSRVFSIII